MDPDATLRALVAKIAAGCWWEAAEYALYLRDWSEKEGAVPAAAPREFCILMHALGAGLLRQSIGIAPAALWRALDELEDEEDGGDER